MTTPQGLVSMRFDGTDRRTHLAVTGKTSYSPGEPEPADEIVLSPQRTMGPGPGHQPALLAGTAAVRRRGAQGLGARAFGSAQEAHRHRGRLCRLGRRRQDDHLGRRLQLLPPAVRFDRLRSAQERRRREGRRQGQSRGREEGTEAQARGSGGRHRAAAGTGRAARSCSRAPRSSRCGATRSFPRARSW